MVGVDSVRFDEQFLPDNRGASMSDHHHTAFRLASALRAGSLSERLATARDMIAGRLVFTTSFGLEDQAVVHAIAIDHVAIEVVTLDTGRLFPETHAVWGETEARYGMRIAARLPRNDTVEALLAAQGIDGFRASPSSRKACCTARKVEPLRHALQGAAGWITGLRAEQSHERVDTPLAAYDAAYGVVKINPLADWNRDAVAAYVAAHRVPYNRLHDRGFLSIGCAPCTRAVAPGEPERAGRWWWEHEEHKECGLHSNHRALLKSD